MPYFNFIVNCCITTTDSLDQFEAMVKSSLSSIKYQWIIILLANYNSQCNSVEYILDNFATIDILSKDIDFYFPGYKCEGDTPIIPNRETLEKELLRKAILELQELSRKDNVSIEKVKEIEDKLRSLINDYNDCDVENYHGEIKKTRITSKRLGTIWFSDEAFASFVVDLTKKTDGHYNYLGGCDLVMIPFFSNELQYTSCKVFHFDNIVNRETMLSVDAFLLQVMDLLRNNINMLKSLKNLPSKIRYESFEFGKTKFIKHIREIELLLKVAKIVPNSIKDLLIKANDLICKSEQFFYRIFKKHKLIEQFASILCEINNDRDYIVNQVIVSSLLDSLYEEATREISYPSDDEITSKIIADIERHVNWRFSDDFYFISYSTKDKAKAELIKRMLQERGVKVWIAPDGIPQGRDYSMIIPTTLKHAGNFVLILTENSAKSKWVSREIDTAINNSSTKIKIILANGFMLNQLNNYPNIEFYINKIQVSYRYEDLIQDAATFDSFMNN